MKIEITKDEASMLIETLEADIECCEEIVNDITGHYSYLDVQRANWDLDHSRKLVSQLKKLLERESEP